MKAFVAGQQVILRVAFTDPDDDSPVTPGVVTATVLKPDGAALSPAPTFTETGTGTGVFEATLTASDVGAYRWRAVASSGVTAAAESEFRTYTNQD